MAQNEKKVGKTRTRATSSELCVRHKKQRSHLYYERRKVKKELEKGGLTDRKLGILFKREDKINSKINDLSFKIFKCGKRYASLKKKRRNISNQISKLKSELLNYRDMPKKEKYSKLAKMKELGNDYRELSIKMRMPVKEKISISRGVVTLESGVDSKIEPVWGARDFIVDTLKGGLIDTVDINGNVYDVKGDALELNFALSDIITEVTAMQKDSSLETPMVNILTDVDNRLITIQYL